MKVLPEKHFFRLNPVTKLLECIDSNTGEVLGVQSSPDVDLQRIEDKSIVQVKTKSGKLVWTEKGLAPKVRNQSHKVWRFSKVWTDLITQAIADGHALHNMGKPKVNGKRNETAHFPPASVIYRWRSEHPEFDEEVKRAIKIRADFFAGKVLETAENAKEYNAKGSRVKVDAYKWLAATSDPDTYGNKTKISGDADQPVTFLIDTGIRRGDATALPNNGEPRTVEGTTLEQEHTRTLELEPLPTPPQRPLTAPPPGGSEEPSELARAFTGLMEGPDLLATDIEGANECAAASVVRASSDVEVRVVGDLEGEADSARPVRTGKGK